MKTFALTAILAAALLATSCSKRTENDREAADGKKEKERELAEGKPGSEENARESEEEGEEGEKPEDAEIAEDCVNFLRATSAAPAKAGDGTCPTCPPHDAAAEVLRYSDLKIDRKAESGESWNVAVRIMATFNPSHGGDIVGGLTGWISPEQRAQYARGETPSGEQVYKVNIVYRRNANGWQPVEFDQ